MLDTTVPQVASLALRTVKEKLEFCLANARQTHIDIASLLSVFDVDYRQIIICDYSDTSCITLRCALPASPFGADNPNSWGGPGGVPGGSWRGSRGVF